MTTSPLNPHSPHLWVLLRGLAREGRHWGDFPSQIQKKFPAAQILCLDYPGFGAATKAEIPWTIESMRIFVNKALQSHLRKFPELQKAPKLLFAISLGGMVALDWLSQKSQPFAASVIINSSLGSLNPPYQRIQPKAMLALSQSAVDPNIRRREARILGIVSNFANRTAEALPLWTQLAESQQSTSQIRRQAMIQQLAAAARFRPDLTKAQKQAGFKNLLLLASEQDRLCRPVCSEALARHLGAPLLLHPSAGHDLPLDDPEWTLTQVEKELFFSKQSG